MFIMATNMTIPILIFMRMDFNFRCRLSVKRWWKITSYVFWQMLSTQRVNPLGAEYLTRNEEIHSHLPTYFDAGTAQEVEIHPRTWQGPVHPTESIQWSYSPVRKHSKPYLRIPRSEPRDTLPLVRITFDWAQYLQTVLSYLLSFFLQ